MLLEKCGQLFFSKMRIAFFYLLVLTPWMFTGTLLFLQNIEIRELEDRFQQASLKERAALKRKLRKERFLKNYGSADAYFLDRHIESLSFLQKEKQQLEFLLTHPAIAQKQALENRLNFLLSPENRLIFKEESVRASSQIKETEEKQRHRVQLDEQDLKILLSRLESCPIDSYLPMPDSPQIIVRDFKLKKVKTPLQTESFELELELFTREFLK